MTEYQGMLRCYCTIVEKNVTAQSKHLKGCSVPRVSHGNLFTTRDFKVFLLLDTFRIQGILLTSCFWTLSLFKSVWKQEEKRPNNNNNYQGILAFSCFYTLSGFKSVWKQKNNQIPWKNHYFQGNWIMEHRTGWKLKGPDKCSLPTWSVIRVPVRSVLSRRVLGSAGRRPARA